MGRRSTVGVDVATVRVDDGIWMIKQTYLGCVEVRELIAGGNQMVLFHAENEIGSITVAQTCCFVIRKVEIEFVSHELHGVSGWIVRDGMGARARERNGFIVEQRSRCYLCKG